MANAPDWEGTERLSLEFAEVSNGERPPYVLMTAYMLALLSVLGFVRNVGVVNGLSTYALTDAGRARLEELREGK